MFHGGDKDNFDEEANTADCCADRKTKAPPVAVLANPEK